MNNNNDISLRIKHIREQAGETLSEFSRNVGIPRSTLVGYENQSTIPASILHIISCKYNISEEWLLSGIGEINKLQKQPFVEPSQGIATGYKNSLKQSVSNSIESLALESTAPRFAELEEKIGEKLNNLQAQIDELKGAVEKKQIEEAYNSPPAYTPDPKLRPYSDLYVAESQSSYGLKKESLEPEETEDLPLAENLAAGIPIEAFDSGETYPVPKKFLKRGKKYCVAKIKGTSMTEAGIIDGSFVLLEYTDTALSGEIMVVKYGEQTTLKRLSQKKDGSWELLYEDGSGAVIPLKDGDWEVKGHYVRVVGK
ncbi:helix-turn-helix domain-containing protein [Treponema denticola]|uniref:helix-turn-helix domain-containing protein n=1 Tax=Treponema denticola TaxID=158 RepID=UPI0011C80A77|nr:LexA family transcriptional regulator [Treponema denticola]